MNVLSAILAMALMPTPVMHRAAHPARSSVLSAGFFDMFKETEAQKRARKRAGRSANTLGPAFRLSTGVVWVGA